MPPGCGLLFGLRPPGSVGATHGASLIDSVGWWCPPPPVTVDWLLVLRTPLMVASGNGAVSRSRSPHRRPSVGMPIASALSAWRSHAGGWLRGCGWRIEQALLGFARRLKGGCPHGQLL